MFERTALQKGDRPHRQLAVAVTANGEDCNTFGEAGFDLICPKPVDKNALLRIIHNYIQEKDARTSVTVPSAVEEIRRESML